MNCPRCRNSETDFSGICRICGYKASEWDEKPPQGEQAEISLTEDNADPELQNIIDAAVSRQAEYLFSEKSDELPSMQAVLEEPASRETDEYESAAALPVAAKDDTMSSLSAEYGERLSVPAFEEHASETDEDKTAVNPLAAESDAAPDDYAASDITDDAETGNVADTVNFLYAANASNPEGRLIFLSRTLSGLIDLLLTSLCSGAFLCAADYFTNAPMLHSVNAANFAVLFLMLYFLYSIFLPGMNSQTVGMTATDLRVVGANGNRPSVKQATCRSAAFLVSLFGLGIGLLTGLFSRECLCLHDRLSGTRVVRVPDNAD